MEASVELFVDDDGTKGVGVVLRQSSIVEYEGELVPGCKLTPWHARCLAHALNEFADQIDGTESS